MGLKRKPPKDNVRRVTYIDRNLRGVITNKAGRTVQFESFNEHIQLLVFERDKSVTDYISQPETFTFSDSDNVTHKYTPDFKVWKDDGTTEIHEVTLTERQERPGIRMRERAAREICQAHKWKYVVHTEKTLPQQTEVTNLLALLPYRLQSYKREQIIAVVKEYLEGGIPIALSLCARHVASLANISEGTVFETLCHLLWHGTLVTNFQELFIDECRFTPEAKVWLPQRKEVVEEL